MQGTRVATSETVLVVEDDRHTSALIRLYLEEAGFVALTARDGRSGLEAARRDEPSLVILDLMLPGLDGWEVCRSLREASDVPILILSARQEEGDRLLGLGLGADDYVVKPFSPREVVARVRAILRRTRGEPGVQHRLGTEPVVLDTDSHQAIAYGREVRLTRSEYKLLHALMRSPGRTFERRELLVYLYPEGATVVPKVIDVHVGNLRKKLEPEPARPRHIVTVRGFGYRFQHGGS